MISTGRDYQRMQDYIVGRLSQDESRVFEDQLLKDPTLVRELDESLRLREGLHGLREQGYLSKAVSPRRRSWIWLPTLAAAACAAVALFLGAYRTAWLHGFSAPLLTASPGSRSTGVEPLTTAHFTFVSVRGSSIPDLDLPSAGFIEFRVAPATREAVARYRMTISREEQGLSSQPLGAVAGLDLSTDGYVHGYVDAARLQAGRYVLSLEPESVVAGPPEAFRFKLRARNDPPAIHD